MTREIKRSKTKLEKLIRTTWQDTKKGIVIKDDGQRVIINALNKTLKHFETDDFLYGTQHKETFKHIYFEASHCHKTKSGLANELYIGEATMTRITNLYIKCFDKFLREIILCEAQNNQKLIVLHL